MGKFIDQLISSESGFNKALRKLVADRSPGKNIEVTKIVDEVDCRRNHTAISTLPASSPNRVAG